MSADLFAEFGHGASTNQPSQPARQQAATPQGSSLIPELNASSPQHLNEPSQSSAQQNSYANPDQFDDFGDFELPQAGSNDDVLFDAALETFSNDGSDDWGEFESAQVSADHNGPNRAQGPVQGPKALEKPVTNLSQKSPSRSSTTVDLLGSLDSFTLQDKPANHFSGPAITLIDDSPTVPDDKGRQKPKVPVEEDSFEDWGDFTDGPIETTRSTSLNSAGETSKNEGNLVKTSDAPSKTTQVSEKAAQPSASHVRPTNIPPPSILLELFPQLFEHLRKQGAEAKKSIQQDTLDSTAQSIIYTLKAVARVVAGRTLRWKRDAILSQSMRIGPARSGKAGGMKLNTVNKNEDIKERQEAIDVLGMWRDRSALFNSVIQAAGRRPVQIVMEYTRVLTAPASQGAIKASHACALCGLKRDERIPKLDENVEDSFGEWWTEHWGHTECRQFWEENMGLLSQR